MILLAMRQPTINKVYDRKTHNGKNKTAKKKQKLLLLQISKNIIAQYLPFKTHLFTREIY